MTQQCTSHKFKLIALDNDYHNTVVNDPKRSQPALSPWQALPPICTTSNEPASFVTVVVQKVTIYPSYSSTRTMPPGFCPCAANSIISLQFWKTYIGWLLSKESNTRCCASLIKLCMVKPRHISPSCCLCILQPDPCDQRTKISSECHDAVW